MAYLHNENHKKTKMAYYLFFFQRFGVKEPSHSETVHFMPKVLHLS